MRLNDVFNEKSPQVKEKIAHSKTCVPIVLYFAKKSGNDDCGYYHCKFAKF